MADHGVTTAAAPAQTWEDWRALRFLSLVRLLLIALLALLYHKGYGADLLQQLSRREFLWSCAVYACAGLLMFVPVIYRTPRLGIQVHLHFVVDLAGIGLLVYFSGGVPDGLGIILIYPLLSCALLLSTRMAVVHAAGATLAMFGEEIIRQSQMGFSASEFTSTGLLGVMFFATSAAASAVAARARTSEALAERVGSEFADLSRLNESILESMHTGVVVVDAAREVRTINAAAVRLLGAGARAGRKLGDVALPLDRTLDAWLRGYAARAEPVATARGAPEVVPRFARLGWNTNPPILILLDDAAALRERAQQMKLAALGRLSASIAHEIRNPLAAISHAGQLLAEAPEQPPENMRLLSMIQRHSGRIDKIVKDVLLLSKREAAEPAQLPLRDWLLRTVAMYQEGFPEQPRPIELLEVAPELVVTFDPSHLQQVVFNLWDNSFEHGGPGAMVLMHAARDEASGQLYLECADNGPGIKPELLERIFEPFFTTSSQGTGLGLYLSRELCEYNQARLTLAPQDKGAAFRIYFPHSNA
ncbi:MAG TPA: ATP-binding protein [Nevskiaceae bacterium]|nr:ATP-binding protein [Nevskiaceae bacterium]